MSIQIGIAAAAPASEERARLEVMWAQFKERRPEPAGEARLTFLLYYTPRNGGAGGSA